jgi:hypothetical protein
MKKVIVTTTIHRPSEATRRFSLRKDWTFIIVGDMQTPHDLYHELEMEHGNVMYLSPAMQEKKYKELSDAIGWKKIQRRNIGFVEAFRLGADIIATVDDDNIPYEDWGSDILVGREVEVDLYEPRERVFDPLSVTQARLFWHRGFPIELLQKRLEVEYKGKVRRKVLVQADLWDGDPDIDALARLSFRPIVRYSDIQAPYCSNKIAPFNSQNTFLSREVLPFYAVLPYVGRMDDIWGSYILQHFFPDSVIYNRASVYQERNEQDLITNLEREIVGYRNTLKLIDNLERFESMLPPEAVKFYQIYRKQFDA